MTTRAKASIIFAVFGALTVFAMFAMRKTATWSNILDTSFLMVVAMAAVSAAFAAATLSPGTSNAPIAMGIVTMLLAQIPFSVLAALYVMAENPRADMLHEALNLFGMALVGGWYVAGLYQIATGALAGWITHRMTRP